MIYLFTGTDSAKVRAKAFQWVLAARGRAPDAPYIRLGTDQLTEEALNEAISSQGLFFPKTLVVLDDPFAESEAAEVVLANLMALKESLNPIGIIAPKLLAARMKRLESVAEKVFTFSTAPKQARDFNNSLVNALGSRDRATVWKEVVLALRSGEAPEAIHGLLHWKARDLMQKGGRGWTKEEARALSVSLIELIQDSRGRDLSLDLSLERFALSI